MQEINLIIIVVGSLQLVIKIMIFIGKTALTSTDLVGIKVAARYVH